MFQSTRVKLTLWYVLIASVITVFFSIIAYNGFRLEFERGLEREQVIITKGLPIVHIVDPDIMNEVRQRLLIRIILTDGFVILISAIAGYIFAGKALQPIRVMVEEQNRFVTDASHELNTPLTSLRASIEVNLRDKKINLDKAKKLLVSNLEEVKSLQALSEELINLSQYQKPTITMQEIQIKDVVKNAVGHIIPLAEEKNIAIVVHAEPALVLGAERSLTELLVILLDNAVKYSNEKQSITVTTHKTDGKVLLTVSDHGIGIEAKDIPYIFDRFYRADKSRTKQHIAGYGLGLSIAKRIVAMHGGTIEVASQLEKGTTFTVTLRAA